MIRYEKFRNHPIWILETTGFHFCEKKKRTSMHPKLYLHPHLVKYVLKIHRHVCI